MEKDGSFSSFFMLLLAATSLIVILSEFFAGNFNLSSSASANPANVEYVEEAAVPEEGTFLENSEELENIDLEDATDDNVQSGDSLDFEINASITPNVEVQEETSVGL